MSDSWVTPNRSTRLVIRPETNQLRQPEWEYPRSASEFRNGLSKTDLPHVGVHQTKAGFWILAPHGNNAIKFVTTPGSNSVIGAGQVNKPDDLHEINMW